MRDDEDLTALINKSGFPLQVAVDPRPERGEGGGR
jgi:hypothetical protein